MVLAWPGTGRGKEGERGGKRGKERGRGRKRAGKGIIQRDATLYNYKVAQLHPFEYRGLCTMASLVGLVIGDIDCRWLDVWNGMVRGGNIKK